MDNAWWLWLGGAIAAVTAMWGHIKSLWALISSLVIVQITIQGNAVNAVQVYLNDEFKHVSIGPRTYIGSWLYVRTIGRVQLVAWRIWGRNGTLYVKDHRLVWLSTLDCSRRNNETNNYAAAVPDLVRVYFWRGAWNPDQFVADAADYYNQIKDREAQSGRHYIKRVFGISHKHALLGGRGQNVEMGIVKGDNSGDSVFFHRGVTPIRHERQNIGVIEPRLKLGDLALSHQAEEAVVEACRWKCSEHWYMARGLTWRRGWLLYGEPGTGKTALARALAEELDLPVFIFDLASLSNDELLAAWREMLVSVPCLALLEDVDAIFHGRETVVGELTFDCLLNCLDGIERADGLFTIITTNSQACLDAALGIAAEGGRSTRPGRVDRAIKMENPTAEGRMKIARRVLQGFPDAWDKVVEDGDGETGAQFQERCASIALSRYWLEKAECLDQFCARKR